MNIKSNNDFKYDLEIGVQFENELADILNNKKIEVKTDLLYEKTGNIFIEIKSRGKPSGLSTTMADYYCIIIPDDDGSRLVMISVKSLKKKLKMLRNKNKLVMIRGGDDNSSVGVLLKINDII